MNKQDLNGFFPYGVSYYRPATPLKKHWDKDLSLIAESGFNTIRVSAFWSRIEKTEGAYDFSEFDGICEAAGKHGLKVLMTLYIVNMPEWMFTRYPDARMVSAGGRVQYSEHHPDAVAGGWPGLCMDDDRVMEHMTKFVREITRHYKGNDVILAFDVIHEPWEEACQEYYIDSWKHTVYCYCEHSIEKFRAWLQKKYGSLDGLNAAWSRCYSDWDQVQPPRNFAAYADWLDWRLFSVEALTRESVLAGEAVKQTDPERITVNHSGGILNAFASSNDAFQLAKTVDIPGMSNYSIRSPESAGMCCDFLRTASPDDGRFWIGETSGGSGPMFSFIGEDIEKFFAFGMPWSAQVQRKHIWKMLSHGAKGLMYWMWRPEIYGCETAAMGFTDREGNATPRVESAAQISSVVRNHQDLFLHGHTQKAQVAVLYDVKSSILEGQVSTAKSQGGEAGLFASYKDLASLKGIAKMCMDASVPLDYLDDSLIEAGALDGYKLLVLPYAICVGEKAAAQIARFVRQGGTVIADALCGYFLENGWGSEVVTGNGLSEVFGAKVIEYGYNLSLPIRLWDGSTFESGFVQEKLGVLGGKVIATFASGEPAAVENAYGEGSAVYFGAPLFLHAGKNELCARRLLDWILGKAGVQNPVRVDSRSGSVEVRVLEHEKCRLAIVMNHSNAPDHAWISMKVPSRPVRVTDAETGEAVGFEMGEAAVSIRLDMDALGVRILSMSF